MLLRRSIFKQGRLPYGYLELEYIENPSNAYIDTGIFTDESTVINLDFSMSKPFTKNTNILGNQGFQNIKSRLVVNRMGNNQYLLGIQDVNATLAADVSDIYHLNIKNNKLIINNKSITTSKSLTKSTYSCYLFTGNSNNKPATSYTQGMRVFAMRIQHANEILREFIPVERKSDNAIGLYDKVEKKFYTSPNGTKFIGN